ncbi:MAG: DUF3343 domain-containing protein [Oscillospiraceae bacterium]|nr:DUF3343 domain-containing protein [Oscillospiraceae bacterium]
MDREIVIAFNSTNIAIKAEASLLEQGENVSVMPLPSQIKAGCGICLRVLFDSLSHALDILTENLSEAQFKELTLYERTEENGRKIYNELNLFNG